MSKPLKGVLVAVATMVGICAYALAIPATTADGFSASASDRHNGVVEFVSARDVGFHRSAVPVAALYRAHQDFSNSRSECFVPADDDFKIKPGKILARVASISQ